MFNLHKLIENTMYPPTAQVRTKVQLFRLHSYWEKCDEMFIFWLRNDRRTVSRKDGKTEQIQ